MWSDTIQVCYSLLDCSQHQITLTTNYQIHTIEHSTKQTNPQVSTTAKAASWYTVYLAHAIIL